MSSETQESWAITRWDGVKSPHYEVYYIKGNLPQEKVSFWLRYTLHIPLSGEKSGALWAIIVDDKNDLHLASKKSFPITDIKFEKTRFQLNIKDMFICSNGASGLVETPKIKWDLEWKSDTRLFKYYPYNFMYTSSWPKTKVVTPYENLFFSGTIETEKKTIDVSKAKGQLGHIWGFSHAKEWVWAHTNLFNEREDIVFEGLSAKPKSTTQQPLSLFYLSIPGELEFIYNGLMKMKKARSTYDLTSWQFRAEQKGTIIEGNIQTTPDKMSGVTYIDTDNSKRYCHNTKIANMELKVITKNGEKKFISNETTAFEYVSTMANTKVLFVI
mgnify:CR=1 FL=1